MTTAWSRQASTIAIDGRAIEVETSGPSPDRAPTLVVLHEGLGSIAMWRDLPRALAERTALGVLSYSRFGYGASARAPLPRPVDYMHREAAFLPSLLAALAIDRPILVGHSDGASIALLYAGATPAAVPAPLALLLEAPHVRVEALTRASIAAAAEPAERDALLPRLQRYHATPASEVFAGWSDVWLRPAFQEWTIEASLPNVTAPTLVVQGDADPYGTWAQVDAIEKGVRGPFASVRLEACGHSPHRDRREATLDAMVAFLRTEVVVA